MSEHVLFFELYIPINNYIREHWINYNKLVISLSEIGNQKNTSNHYASYQIFTKHYGSNIDVV